MYYGPDIIKETGIKVDGVDPDRLSIILNIPLALVNAIGSTVAVFVIDKMGRRFIMLRTLPFTLIACLLVALSMYLTAFTSGDASIKTGNYLAMIALIMYLAFFSIGMSSTVWSVNTEIYPIHLIGSGSSLATATNWFSNFIVSTFFMSIMKNSDVGKVVAFALLGFFCLLAILFIYYLVPETGGRPINENIKNILGPKKYKALIDDDGNQTASQED
uniref:Major facilitator superfamily (MFS) profile domain-containing protein n=1 Tax=Strombidium inclinatum TaxID=197538 RepID=A0A7S3MZJ0_9SPIT|mmetsp:Transcript_32416/g.49585  ORF Transcript_32416/g.49585 Transcript_32416/m.49585 type:complete len:217 (+) Transcript_32416:894-1544(+)